MRGWQDYCIKTDERKYLFEKRRHPSFRSPFQGLDIFRRWISRFVSRLYRLAFECSIPVEVESVVVLYKTARWLSIVKWGRNNGGEEGFLHLFGRSLLVAWRVPRHVGKRRRRVRVPLARTQIKRKQIKGFVVQPVQLLSASPHPLVLLPPPFSSRTNGNRLAVTLCFFPLYSSTPSYTVVVQRWDWKRSRYIYIYLPPHSHFSIWKEDI